MNLPHLPFAERLLHVECDGEEIVCEITPLYSHFFIAHIRLPEINIALVAKAESAVDPDTPLDGKSIMRLSGECHVTRSRAPNARISGGEQADRPRVAGERYFPKNLQ